MASALQEAKERFELAQEALERFTQENIRITLAGSEFISTGNVDQVVPLTRLYWRCACGTTTVVAKSGTKCSKQTR